MEPSREPNHLGDWCRYARGQVAKGYRGVDYSQCGPPFTAPKPGYQRHPC